MLDKINLLNKYYFKYERSFIPPPPHYVSLSLCVFFIISCLYPDASSITLYPLSLGLQTSPMYLSYTNIYFGLQYYDLPTLFVSFTFALVFNFIARGSVKLSTPHFNIFTSIITHCIFLIDTRRTYK